LSEGRTGFAVATLACPAVAERSWVLAAAMFSSRYASDDVPGIGNMTGDFSSNHASASCTTLTL